MSKPRSRSRAAAVIDAFDRHPDLDAARTLLERFGDELPLSPFAEILQELGIAEPEPEGDSEREAFAESSVRESMRVARSDVAAALPIAVGLPVATAPRMRATRVSGPFRGTTGLFWLHFFDAPRTVSIFRQGDAQPSLVISAARMGTPKRTSLELRIGAGTVWIAANALDPAFPAGTYAGFTVTSGTLRFTANRGKQLHVDRPEIQNGERIDFDDDDVHLVLDVKPAEGTVSGNRCPAKPSVTGPDSVRIEWRTNQPPKFQIGKASVTFTDQTINVAATDNRPRHETALSAIVFPASLEPKQWEASALQSDILSLEGTTRLNGGWALSTVHPSSPGALTEALGPGFFLFFCEDRLHAGWGEGEGTLELAPPVLAVSDGQFLLLAGGRSEQMTRPLRLWAVRDEGDAPRIPLSIDFAGPGRIAVYVCDSKSGEAFYATCAADIALDRPVTIKGAPLTFGRTEQAWLAVERSGDTTTIRLVALNLEAVSEPNVTLALRNALIPSTQPLLAVLDGMLADHGMIDEGMLSLAIVAHTWAPTLPDPYVTSRPLPKSDQRLVHVSGLQPTLLAAIVRWTEPPLPKVSFIGLLGAPLGVEPPRTADPSSPMRQSTSQIRVPTQTAQGAELIAPPASFAGFAPTFMPSRVQERAAVNEIRGLRLLDVSTEKDLLGVELFSGFRSFSQFFVVNGLDVWTPAALLRVFALPQVQWEPVRTLDRDQDILLGHFPSPLASVTDGGATALAVNSLRLVPAIPDLAVDAVLEEFANGKQAALVTTLPFGLKAFVELRAVDDVRQRDSIQRNEPEFKKPDLRGGAQLAFIAESGPSGRRQSSHFDGFATQTLNGVSLADGSPLGISVLGSVVDPADSVQEMFNNEFSQTGAKPKVPVTRLDVSGYGGSCFSDWVNLDATFASAARVQFQVMVGRTALEVVKFATVLYPWGVRLTRTVTIERKGGGGVIRRDSGWQPASEGLFQFPGTSYQVHPGLLRGLFSIRNLRSTGMAPVRFSGIGGRDVVLAPKFFDARVRIDGLEGPADIAGDGILGFLQIQPVGDALHEEELRILIAQQGPIGGPVDGIVNVGGSGFRVRATRVEVGLGNASNGRPELVGVVRTAPVFKQDGSWAAVRGPGPSNAHTDAEFVNTNEVQGLPVVREGELLGVTGNTMNIGGASDTRFCDPADLHRPDDPEFEYAILQTSPAHGFLFPRPHVVQGVTELRTRTVPFFADTLARSTGKGLFPPKANAITLPANVLVVNAATGGFRLRDAVDMNAPRPPLIVSQRGSDVIQLDYTPARLLFSFDQNNWNADLRNLEMWTDVTGIDKVAGIRMTLTGGTSVRPVVQNIQSLMMSLIEDALTFLGGLGARPEKDPIDLTATNRAKETEITVDAGIHWSIPPKPVPHTASVKFEMELRAHVGWGHEDATPTEAATDTLAIGASLTFAVQGKIPIKGPVYLLIGGQIAMGVLAVREHGHWDAEDVFELKAYLGVLIEAGVFEGSLAVGYQMQIQGNTVKHGIFVVLEAEVDLKVVKVSVSGELGGFWYDADPSHLPDRHASDCVGEIEVNVELLVFSFSASVEFSSTNYYP